MKGATIILALVLISIAYSGVIVSNTQPILTVQSSNVVKQVHTKA